DEEHVARLQGVGEDGRQVARLLDGRSGGDADAHAELGGDDVRQRGLAQPGRAVQQHVVQRLTPVPRRFQVDLELALEALLADVSLQGSGPDTYFIHVAESTTHRAFSPARQLRAAPRGLGLWALEGAREPRRGTSSIRSTNANSQGACRRPGEGPQD